ncbi:MAG: TolC family protein [Pseudobdellovibrionaceae bacterium]|nr:TolC family protein [Pseudobdellovibrionaceae bacterium]
MLSCVALMSLTMLPLLGGCTGDVVDMDGLEHKAMLERDRAEIAQYEGQTIRITLDQALKRAVEKNLDARVAELDLMVQDGNVTLKQLEALPQLKSSRTLNSRSDLGASSSRSVQSGLQSLEPSQSTDRRRMTTSLQASWNLLDAGLALSETYRMQDETGIVEERYNKVIQNIERDVYAAYWRAWESEKTAQTTNQMIASGERQLSNLEKASDGKLLGAEETGDKSLELEDRMRSLQELDNNLASAEIELKVLLSYPQSANLELVAPSSERAKIQNLLTGNIIDQEWSALKSRPELREEVYQKNIAVKNARHELFKTLPGVEPLVAYNTDTNSFLQDKQWSTFSLSITQNILNLLTLPMRYEAAKQKELQADARRQALAAALVAQVHLARQRLEQDRSLCSKASNAAALSQKRARAKQYKSKTGVASGGEALVARMDAQISMLRKSMSCAQMQDSYAAMVNSLGLHLYQGELPIEKFKAEQEAKKKKMEAVNG